MSASHSHARKPSSGASSKPAANSASLSNGQRTAPQRTPFSCTLHYANTLPPIPFDPKLLLLPLDPGRYAHYHTTSLETNYQHVIHTEPDLGVPINLIDPEAYTLKPGATLSREDQQLLTLAAAAAPSTPARGSDKSASSSTTPSASLSSTPGSGGIGARKKTPSRRDGVAKQAVSWLRKHTEYITSDGDQKKFARKQVESEFGKRAASSTEFKQTRSDKEIAAAIDRTFEVAKQMPVHATDPKLTVVEILPVLPDEPLWGNIYSQVVFDTDPEPDVGIHIDTSTQPPHEVSAMRDLKRKRQSELELNAVAKGFSSGERESFVTYLVPKSVPEGEAEEYQWVREYRPRVEHSKTPHYCFEWRADGVYYTELASKVLLEKIKSKETKKNIREKVQPRKMYKVSREVDAQDEAQMADRRAMLEPPSLPLSP